MAGRRPLVHSAGGFQELPATDWLSRPGGVVDCSGMTTAAQVNAAADPAVAGANATIWLGPRTTPLDVDQTLILWGGQTWLGAGGRELHTTLRAVSGLGAGLPIMASEGWYNNAGDADEPVIIRGIRFDLNGLTARCGLVVYNFWSHVDDCQFVGASGDCANLLVTDRTRNNTQSSNSHSENRFTALRFDTSSNGARHFETVTTNGISNQDGHLLHSFFAGANGPAVLIDRAAGWTIAHNHLYGCGDNAIDLSNCYATTVACNYVEDFGVNNVTSGPTGGYYTAINLATVLDGKPSVVTGNTISLVEPGTVVYNRATCLGMRAGSGQTAARVAVTGNTIALDGTATGNNAEAVRLGEGGDSGRLLTVSWAGNQIDPRPTFETVIFQHEPTTRVWSADEPFVRALGSVTGTLTLDADLPIRQVEAAFTGDVTLAVPTNGVNGVTCQLVAYASGAQRVLTFDAGLERLGGVLASYTIPSGKKVRVALRCSTVDGGTDWVVDAAGVTQ